MTKQSSSGRGYLNNAPALRTYLAEIHHLGFLVGAQDSQVLSKDCRILLTALHQVLAGGKLQSKSIKVTRKGPKDGINKEVTKKLDRLAKAAVDEANQKPADVRYG